jgi:hypothetical protein
VPVWTGAENLAPIGIRSPDRQPVASRYTDYAIGSLKSEVRHQLHSTAAFRCFHPLVQYVPSRVAALPVGFVCWLTIEGMQPARVLRHWGANRMLPVAGQLAAQK